MASSEGAISVSRRLRRTSWEGGFAGFWNPFPSYPFGTPKLPPSRDLPPSRNFDYLGLENSAGPFTYETADVENSEVVTRLGDGLAC